MSTDFAPDSLVARHRTVSGKHIPSVTESEFVLRDGLYARSRPVDSDRPVLLSTARAALNKLTTVSFRSQQGTTLPVNPRLEITKAADVVLAADYTGIVTSGPVAIRPVTLREGVDVSADPLTTYDVSFVGVTALVNTTGGDPLRGTVTITGLPVETGIITWQISYDGVVQQTVETRATKQRAPAPPPLPGLETMQGSIYSNSTAGSFALTSEIVSFATVAPGTFSASADAAYEVTYGGSGTSQLELQWAYRPTSGGGWTYFGASVVGSVAERQQSYYKPYAGDYYENVAAVPGSVHIEAVAVLPAGNWDVALFGRVLGTDIVTFGSFFVERTY